MQPHLVVGLISQMIKVRKRKASFFNVKKWSKCISTPKSIRNESGWLCGKKIMGSHLRDEPFGSGIEECFKDVFFFFAYSSLSMYLHQFLFDLLLLILLPDTIVSRSQPKKDTSTS